jgi:hypothetical protein
MSNRDDVSDDELIDSLYFQKVVKAMNTVIAW